MAVSELRRELGLLDAVGIGFGAIVGAGIFAVTRGGCWPRLGAGSGDRGRRGDVQRAELGGAGGGVSAGGLGAPAMAATSSPLESAARTFRAGWIAPVVSSGVSLGARVILTGLAVLVAGIVVRVVLRRAG